MIRHNKFEKVFNLDNELDGIVEGLTVLIGKKVTEFPPINQIPELAQFVKKGQDGKFRQYRKIDGKMLVASVDTNGYVVWIEGNIDYGSS